MNEFKIGDKVRPIKSFGGNIAWVYEDKIYTIIGFNRDTLILKNVESYWSSSKFQLVTEEKERHYKWTIGILDSNNYNINIKSDHYVSEKRIKEYIENKINYTVLGYSKIEDDFVED